MTELDLFVSPLGRVEGDLDVRVTINDGVVTSARIGLLAASGASSFQTRANGCDNMLRPGDGSLGIGAENNLKRRVLLLRHCLAKSADQFQFFSMGIHKPDFTQAQPCGAAYQRRNQAGSPYTTAANNR